MRFVVYFYTIPGPASRQLYPAAAASLRRFSLRIQQSVWVMPEAAFSRTANLTTDILAAGGIVDHVLSDESEEARILARARTTLHGTVDALRQYIVDSIATANWRLEQARKRVSLKATNDAIRYQQGALSRTYKELNDAEECATCFGISNELAEWLTAAKLIVEQRAEAFVAERDAVRSSVRAADDVDPAALGFGLEPEQTTLPGTEEPEREGGDDDE